MSGDLIYGAFAFGAAAMTALSVIKLFKAGRADGVSFLTPLYFAVWGVANLFVFAPDLAPISFWANVLLTVINTIYFIGVIVFDRRMRAQNTVV